MTAEELWKALRGAQVSGDALYELAKDLYFARPAVSSGKFALNALSNATAQHPLILYSALNIDPGKATLTKLGEDYNAAKAWAAVAPETRAYVQRVATRLNDLNAKVEAQKAKLSTAPAPKADPAPAKKTAVSTRSVLPSEPARASKSFPVLIAIGAMTIFEFFAISRLRRGAQRVLATGR